jgi:hypothetical protein
MYCRRAISRSRSYAILTLSLVPIGKEINIYLAMVVGLGNAGGSHETLLWQRQMAVLVLPYGKPGCTGNCLLQS